MVDTLRFITLTLRAMLAKVISCAVVGLDGYMVQVEVDISPGLPKFFVVGLPDEAIQEARENVFGELSATPVLPSP